jgi:DNA polymerase-3 subunit gamma/tau
VSYTVFARKYRPQTFEDVVGQEHIVRTMRNAITMDRLSQAYLFVGPRGTGKTSMARIFSKALNCLSSDRPTTTPCGVCSNCTEIAAGNSLSVLEFDAASNTQVEKIREIIIDNAKYLPVGARYKVYLVDEVHMLSTSSFNALLKTIEEPPPHVKFLFATTEAHKVPSTILSRCQRFDLKRIGTNLIASHLQKIAEQEGVAIEPGATLAVAKAADGGMRDAESMLDQLVAFCGDRVTEEQVSSVFGFTSRQTVVSLCGAVLRQDAGSALRVVAEQAEAGRDLSQLVKSVIGYLRDLLLVQASPDTVLEEYGPAEREILRTEAGGIARERLLELVEMFAEAEERVRWAANRRMHVEVAVLRGVQLAGQVTLSDVLVALQRMKEGKPVEVPVAPAPTTPVPVVQAPVAQAPVAQAPAVQAPVVQAPLVQAPVVQAPVVQAPVVQAPVAQAPVVQAPVVQAPVAQAPVVQAPVVSAPVVSAPVVSAPVVQVGGEDDESPFAGGGDVGGGAAVEVVVDLNETWVHLVNEVRRKRPLIRMWLEFGCLAEVADGRAVVAFPPHQGLAMEQLDSPANRELMAEILTDRLGRRMTVSVEVRDAAVSAPVQTQSAARAVPKTAEDVMAEFKADPLIRKALEIFKATLEADPV